MQIIIITGASSGFGKATAERLAAKGYTVYGTSRNEVQHKDIHFLVMDVRDRDSVSRGVERIVEEQGRIDVVVNNAGMGIGGSLEMATGEEIELQMGTNFRGCVNVCQAVLPVMRRQGGGQVVNLSSIGGVMGLPYQGFTLHPSLQLKALPRLWRPKFAVSASKFRWWSRAISPPISPHGARIPN